MSKERPILATLTRKHQTVWVRRYARIDSAIPRAVQLAILEGQPGDVVEFARAVTSLQIGTVRLSVGGKLTASWIWD